MLALEGCPYEVSEAVEGRLLTQIKHLESRVALLRGEGHLSDETLRRYYQNTRLLDVTESNAIEGSTLALHETELAVMRGATLTGHDPGYVRDAKSLFRAFERLAELARDKKPVDIEQAKEIHGLILGERPGAGVFRTEPVSIRGARHVPPRDWSGVMKGMEDWEKWSLDRAAIPAPLRAMVLHAWLAHVHPFVDGNGRTARAITTLELIRAGYPPIIVRRKDRERYYEALALADDGDLAGIVDLVLSRANDALRDLERTAGDAQGYRPALAALKLKQANQLAIWNKAVDLLLANVRAEVANLVAEAGGSGHVQDYDAAIDLDDYVELWEGHAISDAWAFSVEVHLPALGPASRLAWIGFRSDTLTAALGGKRGPTVFWSAPNPRGTYPRWRRAFGQDAPAGEELTYEGDGWVVRQSTGKFERLGPSEVAQRIVHDLVKMA
jgi:Fic family protein